MSGIDYSPHRRSRQGRLAALTFRAWERVVVAFYRATSAVLAQLPLALTEPIAQGLFLVGYVLWPAKRRIIEGNAGHILSLPPQHRDARRLARAIYATFSRFTLEVMRLPNLPANEPTRLLVSGGADDQRFMELWERCEAEGRGIIAVSGHIGSIEVFAGAYAQRGIPTYGLADDSAFPELFELLNRSRERWGVTIIPWRNLRDIFRVMRKPAILGMVVDWGYRSDGLPVRLCGDATRLPAGPATLAARTNAVIVPVVARRQADGRYEPIMYDPIEPAGGSAEELQRATQAIADALSSMVVKAPDQWYTFKPMWPAGRDEAAEIEVALPPERSLGRGDENTTTQDSRDDA